MSWKLKHASKLPGDVAFRQYIDRMKKETGKNRAELAEAFGVCANTLTNWMDDASMIKVYYLRRLIRDHDLTPEEVRHGLEVEE